MEKPNEPDVPQGAPVETPEDALKRRFENGGMSRGEYDAAMAELAYGAAPDAASVSTQSAAAVPAAVDKTGAQAIPAGKGRK